MDLIVLILVVGALVLFLIAGLFAQGTGKIHFGWLGLAALTAYYLINKF